MEVCKAFPRNLHGTPNIRRTEDPSCKSRELTDVEFAFAFLQHFQTRCAEKGSGISKGMRCPRNIAFMSMVTALVVIDATLNTTTRIPDDVFESRKINLADFSN